VSAGLDHFALDTSLLDVSMHVIIYSYKVNSGISVKFIQRQVRITLSIMSTFLSLWLPVF